MKVRKEEFYYLIGLFLSAFSFFILTNFFNILLTKILTFLIFTSIFASFLLKIKKKNRFIKLIQNENSKTREANTASIQENNKFCFAPILNSCLDLTQYPKTDIHMRKLSIAVEQSPTSIVITDLSGNIEYTNPKFTELTGYSLEEVQGRNSSYLKSGKTSKDIYKNLWETILKGKTWKGEFINKKKSGEEFIENAIISPIFDDDGNIINFIALYEDISEKKYAEKKILEQQEQLAKSYKDLEIAKRKVEDYTKDIEKLNEITRTINSSLKTSIILKNIYSYICEQTGFNTVWILLVDKRRERIFSDSNLSIFNSIENLDINFFCDFKMNLSKSLGILYHTYLSKIPFYATIAATTKYTVKNLYENKIYKLKRLDFEINKKGKFKSVLQIPLILKNEVVGILNLTSQNQSVELEKDDIHKLMRFADQIAGIIFNAHLMEELEEAKQNAEISEKISLLAQKEMEQEKRKSDQLLLNILPEEVAKELRYKGTVQPIQYQSVSVMFTDFKGFSKIAETMTPKELIKELDICFSYFDSLMDRYHLEKLKTIGDSYMCAGGIPVIKNTHPVDIVLAALEIQSLMIEAKKLRNILKLPFWELRLGIHTGTLIAGVIGEKKFAYDVWGDTVNLASRMEGSGTPDRINISWSTYNLVKDFFECEYRGELEAKNKGLVSMYYVNGIKKELCLEDETRVPSYRFWVLYDRLKKGELLNPNDIRDRRIGKKDTREKKEERRKAIRNPIRKE